MQTNKLINYIDPNWSILYTTLMLHEIWLKREDAWIFSKIYLPISLVWTVLIFYPPSQLLKNQKTFRQKCISSHYMLLLYPPQTKLGGYVVFTLYVCLSVYLLSLNMILSMHVLKNGCMGFSDFFLKTHYSQCINVHLECSYWLYNVYKFFRLFSVYGLGHSFYE